jgi:hypothetical protein
MDKEQAIITKEAIRQEDSRMVMLILPWHRKYDVNSLLIPVFSHKSFCLHQIKFNKFKEMNYFLNFAD